MDDVFRLSKPLVMISTLKNNRYKNHAFLIDFTHILEMFKLNAFSIIEKKNLLVNNEKVCKSHGFFTLPI